MNTKLAQEELSPEDEYGRLYPVVIGDHVPELHIRHLCAAVLIQAFAEAVGQDDDLAISAIVWLHSREAAWWFDAAGLPLAKCPPDLSRIPVLFEAARQSARVDRYGRTPAARRARRQERRRKIRMGLS